MSAISTVSSQFSAVAAVLAQSRRSVADSPTAAATTPSSQVSISEAAREAARNDAAARPGLKLSAAVMEWFNKDFSPEILNEAKARLEDIRDNGELGAFGPMNLPLLPENQELLDGFRQEMRALSAGGHANMSEEQSARFNLLMNLGMRLQLVGWEKPMTEAGVQREFDVSNAMAKLVRDDPGLRPPTPPERAPEEIIADIRSDKVTAVWRERWAAAGLTMPTDTPVSPERSMWLDLAQAAGIGADEFMTALRGMASDMKGQALTRAMESFISERYIALNEAKETAAPPAVA
ncbi:hypothetical protein MASR1M60_33450 [Rhodocyclaceae bacterium]